MAEEQLNRDLRLERGVPSRIERRVYQPEIFEDDIENTLTPQTHRPGIVNFACMIIVGATFDIVGFFLSEIPFVGAGIVIVADLIFIPWLHFSGMKFNNKRVVATAAQTIGEAIPFVGNMPLITINIIYSYYSN